MLGRRLDTVVRRPTGALVHASVLWRPGALGVWSADAGWTAWEMPEPLAERYFALLQRSNARMGPPRSEP
jgi:hypothetical protein